MHKRREREDERLKKKTSFLPIQLILTFLSFLIYFRKDFIWSLENILFPSSVFFGISSASTSGTIGHGFARRYTRTSMPTRCGKWMYSEPFLSHPNTNSLMTSSGCSAIVSWTDLWVCCKRSKKSSVKTRKKGVRPHNRFSPTQM